MGRIYNVPLARTAVTAILDLVEITNAATQTVMIHAIELTQSTELGDAQEEMLKLSWLSGQTSSGSGGTGSITAIPVLIGDAASGLTIEVFNTTTAFGGTVVTHKVFDWNIRVPFIYPFTPETRLSIPPSGRATLQLITAPADSVTIGGQIVIEVIG